MTWPGHVSAADAAGESVAEASVVKSEAAASSVAREEHGRIGCLR
jgi:hypothetical protein